MNCITTVWPEILAENYFGGLAVLRQSASISSVKNFTMYVIHYCEIVACVLGLQLNAPANRRHGVTIESCVRGHRFSKKFCTPKEKSWLFC